MLKKSLLCFALIGAGFLAGRWDRPAPVYAQNPSATKVLKKSWGPVRSAYTEPRTSELWMVLEDEAGTVRQVRVYAGNGSRPSCRTGEPCVDVLYELSRD